MKFFLSLCVLASLAVVSGHVIAVYQGTNMPWRGATSRTSDATPSTTGPCGEGTTFGSNGVTVVTPGQVINMQLEYQSAHPNPSGGPNYFALAMICTSGKTTDLDSATPLRLYDATTVGGTTVYQNQKNNVGITPITVNAQMLTSLPFTMPFNSPTGSALTAGDYCTVSIMDERSWGGCLDLKIGTTPGPIVAGVMTPVIAIGAGAAVFFARGSITRKLMPSQASANPDGRMFRVTVMSAITLILSIVACATPAWSTGSMGQITFKQGPWSFCPSNNNCYSSVSSGIAAMYAVRFFVISSVVVGIMQLFINLGAFFQRIDQSLAAKFSTGSFIYMMLCAFAAMMIWVCMLAVGQSIGGALIVDIIVLVFSLIAACMSYTWLKAIGMAPKAEFSTSGPLTTGGKPVGVVSTPAAVSYPKSAVVTSTPKAAATSANNKWNSWEERWDEENQAFYFFNHSNGESAWEPPRGWPYAPKA